MTDNLKGKVIETEELKVSEDGKTLTVTNHVHGEQKPTIVVFDKI